MLNGQKAILWPVVAIATLTAIVWVKLYMDRISEIRNKRINPEKLVSPQATSALLQNTRASDNLRNLFELPVLFYVLCLALFTTGLSTKWLVLGAWLYVLLRIAHSVIHITYNRVMHRFSVYAASCVVLFVLWAMFAWRLLLAR